MVKMTVKQKIRRIKRENRRRRKKVITFILEFIAMGLGLVAVYAYILLAWAFMG